MDRFGDSRNKDKATRQSKWVQDMLADNSQDRIVGRDMSESLVEKSTTNASSAHATKNCANSVPGTTDFNKEASVMEEMKELGKTVNRSVELTLAKIQNEVKTLKEGYIVKIGTLNDTIARLRADVMYYEKEQERVEEIRKLNKLLKKILFWTFGSIIGLVFVILLLLYLGWI